MVNDNLQIKKETYKLLTAYITIYKEAKGIGFDRNKLIKFVNLYNSTRRFTENESIDQMINQLGSFLDSLNTGLIIK